MRFFLLLSLVIFLSEASAGQKFLQLEKVNSPRSRKYFPGDQITFQMQGGQWYQRVIEDVSYDRKLLIFASGHVHVDSIMAFKTYNNQRWSRALGRQLYYFGIAWVGYGTIAAAVDGDASDVVSGVGLVPAASSAALGFALQKIFKSRTFRMKRNRQGEALRWRLRVLDLNVRTK